MLRSINFWITLVLILTLEIFNISKTYASDTCVRDASGAITNYDLSCLGLRVRYSNENCNSLVQDNAQSGSNYVFDDFAYVQNFTSPLCGANAFYGIEYVFGSDTRHWVGILGNCFVNGEDPVGTVYTEGAACVYNDPLFPTPTPSSSPTPSPFPSPTPYVDNPNTPNYPLDPNQDIPVISPDGDSITFADGSIITLNGDPETASNPNCASCPQPVNLATGSMWHELTDFTMAGRTPETAIEFRRVYLSKSITPTNDFGPHWFHSYQTQILAEDFSQYPNLIWIDQHGGSWTFTRNADHTLKSPPSFFGTLNEYSDRYEIVQKHGTTLVFTRNSSLAPVGKLISIKDRHGEHVNLAYASGKLASVSGALAGTITFTRNSAGLISKISRLRDGLVNSYTYNANNNLASSADTAGNVTQYSYVAANNASKTLLSSITDPLNRSINFVYNTDGTVYSTSEFGGAKRTFQYGTLNGNRATYVVDVDGRASTSIFDAQLRLIEVDKNDGSKIEQTFNSFNSVASRTDERGNTSIYSYDARDNLTSIKKPLDIKPTTITYNQDYDVPSGIAPAIDSAMNLTLNFNGDVTELDRNHNSSTLKLLTDRDFYGNPINVNNGLTPYANQYDDNGFLTTKFDLYNPEVRTYDSRGRLSKSTFKSGRILQYAYDDFDRLLNLTDSNGPAIAFAYDAVGRLLSKTVGSGSAAQVTHYLYDARDRISKITDPSGKVTTYSYDQTLLGLDKPESITDANGKKTTFTYDSMSRLFKKTDALGNVAKYEYDLAGNLTTLVDPKGLTTVFTYDANNRVSKKIEASVQGVSGKNQVVNQETDYVYDDQGRVTEARLISSSVIGQMDVMKTIYDDLGRVVEKLQYRSNNGTISSVQDDSKFAYAPTLDQNLLTEADNGSALLSFTSDFAPPFKDQSFRQQIGSFDNSYFISRDVTGEIAGIKDRTGIQVVSSHYDPAGRLTTSAANALSVALSYDSFGRKSKVTESTGMAGSYTYDIDNRVSTIAWTEQQRGFFFGLNNVSENLTYDAVGNVTKQAREFFSTSYAYDSTYQLTGVNFSLNGILKNALMVNRTFQYDQNGNRVTDSAQGASQYINNFLDSGDGNQNLSDSNGYGGIVTQTNPKTKDVQNFTYRVDGKLTSFSEYFGKFKLQGATYQYDAFGRRIAKKISFGGTATRNCDESAAISQIFIYLDQQDKILQAKAGNGTVVTYLDGQGIDEHFGHSSSRETVGYLTDHLGSVLNTTVAGPLRAYGAFGESVFGAFEAFSTRNPVLYGFAGRQFDSESSLYYNRARMYDPVSGRFTSKDPMGLAAGDLNLYRYTGNNPLRYTDPSGKIFGIDDAIFAGIAIVGTVVGITTAVIEYKNGGSLKDIGTAFIQGFLTGATSAAAAVLTAGASTIVEEIAIGTSLGSALVAAGIDIGLSALLAPTSVPSSALNGIVPGLQAIENPGATPAPTSCP